MTVGYLSSGGIIETGQFVGNGIIETVSVAPTGFKVYWIQDDESETMKKNVAGQDTGAQMITISDGSNFTGTVSVDVTIDGGTQTSGVGTVTHEGNGYHGYVPTQAETNGDHIAFTFTGTGALTKTKDVYTNFPQTVDNNVLLSGLNDFDPTTDTVANVTTTANLTTNNDKTGYSISGTKTTLDALNDIAATDIVSAGAITTLSGAIVNVDLVDTCTTNTDQRGTDNALLAASYTAPDNTTILDTNAKVTALNDISAADVWSVATRELTSGNNIVLAKGVGLTGLNDIAAIDVLASGDIDGFSLEESQKLILATGVGVLSGAATTAIAIQAADNSKTRVLATVDSDGNRTAVIKDATG